MYIFITSLNIGVSEWLLLNAKCMEIFVSLLTWLFSYLEVSFPPKPKRVLLKIITYIFLLQLSDVITGACNIGRYAVIDCRYPYEYNGGHIIVSSIILKF